MVNHCSSFTFYPALVNSFIMPDYFKDNEGAELSGGDFLATADGTGQNTFFSNCKDLRIMGGLHIAPGQDKLLPNHQL